jgi:hypothetical protein
MYALFGWLVALLVIIVCLFYHKSHTYGFNKKILVILNENSAIFRNHTTFALKVPKLDEPVGIDEFFVRVMLTDNLLIPFNSSVKLFRCGKYDSVTKLRTELTAGDYVAVLGSLATGEVQAIEPIIKDFPNTLFFVSASTVKTNDFPNLFKFSCFDEPSSYTYIKQLFEEIITKHSLPDKINVIFDDSPWSANSLKTIKGLDMLGTSANIKDNVNTYKILKEPNLIFIPVLADDQLTLNYTFSGNVFMFYNASTYTNIKIDTIANTVYGISMSGDPKSHTIAKNILGVSVPPYTAVLRNMIMLASDAHHYVMKTRSPETMVKWFFDTYVTRWRVFEKRRIFAVFNAVCARMDENRIWVDYAECGPKGLSIVQTPGPI